MKRYEITKYENEEGIIEEQEWIAISDIGGTFGGDIVNIGLHFILKNVRPYAAPCSEA